MTTWPDSAHDAQPTIVPQPSNFSAEPGLFDLTRIKAILIEPDLPEVREAAFQLAREVSNRLGRFIRCAALDPDPKKTDVFGCIGVSTATKKMFLGSEGYDLDIKKELAFLSAPNPTGLFRGIKSLLQLVLPDAEGGFVLPAVRAIDKPSTAWRGVRLDLRTAVPPFNWLERFIDLVALLRLNTLRLVMPTGAIPAYSGMQISRLLELSNERKIELLCEPDPSGGEETSPVFQVVRLSVGANDDVARAIAEELKPDEDSALPSVNGIWWLKPDELPLAEDRKSFGLEAWLRWPPGIAPPILDRAFTSRLAAFAEMAWTGPFRRTFVDFRHRLGNLFREFDRLGFDYDVPPPGGLPDTVFLDDEIAIELVPPCPGADVQFTLDGSDPTSESPTADRPLFLKTECVVRARTRLRNGKVSVPVTIEVRRRTHN